MIFILLFLSRSWFVKIFCRQKSVDLFEKSFIINIDIIDAAIRLNLSENRFLLFRYFSARILKTLTSRIMFSIMIRRNDISLFRRQRLPQILEYSKNKKNALIVYWKRIKAFCRVPGMGNYFRERSPLRITF
jgi:hypothetical protein